MPIFNEKVKLLIRNLDEKVSEGQFDITPMMHACTLDMICGEFIRLAFQKEQVIADLFHIEIDRSFCVFLFKRDIINEMPNKSKVFQIMKIRS